MTLNLKDYAIALDVWEGSGDSNESILLQNGVEAMFVRMNESAGQLRYDVNFLKQWDEAKAFKRCAYVVVSPLNIGHTFTAAEIVAWILEAKPTDCNIIALDVEIDAAKLYGRPDITPAYYSKFLSDIFAGLHAAGIVCVQYSGAWFYNLVKPWVKPDYVSQWWARYLNAIYPPVPPYPSISWADFKAKVALLDWAPLSPGYTELMTGKISIWQITSVYVLPGCQVGTPVDVNLIPRSEFNKIFGAPVVVPPVVEVPTLASLDRRVKVLEDWKRSETE